VLRWHRPVPLAGHNWLPEIAMYNYKASIYSLSFGRLLQTKAIGNGE
jgi:hypothetical protein